jgi:hypothetical protein
VEGSAVLPQQPHLRKSIATPGRLRSGCVEFRRGSGAVAEGKVSYGESTADPSTSLRSGRDDKERGVA